MRLKEYNAFFIIIYNIWSNFCSPAGDLLGAPNSDSVSGVLRLVEGGGYESSSSSCPGGAGGQRSKRMRTSFKHHQLRTMKSYFGINQNPDAKDLKQLAQKTGLSKRVLQVYSFGDFLW